jgi:hypothetical protein
MTERGMWVLVGGLQPASTATVVRSHAGEESMTDGPLTPTRSDWSDRVACDARTLQRRARSGRLNLQHEQRDDDREQSIAERENSGRVVRTFEVLSLFVVVQ